MQKARTPLPATLTYLNAPELRGFLCGSIEMNDYREMLSLVEEYKRRFSSKDLKTNKKYQQAKRMLQERKHVNRDRSRQNKGPKHAIKDNKT